MALYEAIEIPDSSEAEDVLQLRRDVKAESDLIDLISNSSGSTLGEAKALSARQDAVKLRNKKTAAISNTLNPRTSITKNEDFRNNAYGGSGVKIMYRTEDGSSKMIAINDSPPQPLLKQTLQDTEFLLVDSANKTSSIENGQNSHSSAKNTPIERSKNGSGRATPLTNPILRSPMSMPVFSNGGNRKVRAQKRTRASSSASRSSPERELETLTPDHGYRSPSAIINGLQSSPTKNPSASGPFHGNNHARPWEATSRTAHSTATSRSSSRTPVHNDFSRDSSRLSSVRSSHPSDTAPRSYHIMQSAKQSPSSLSRNHPKQNMLTKANSSRTFCDANGIRLATPNQPSSNKSKPIPIAETLGQIGQKSATTVRVSDISQQPIMKQDLSELDEDFNEQEKVTVPMTYESFRTCLRGHLRRMEDDHMHLVQASLRQARQNRQPRSLCHMQATSPFDGKTTDQHNGIARIDTGKFGHFVKHVKHTNDKRESSTSHRITNCSQTALAIPPYTNYISAKRSVLTEDDKQRTFFPHHEDDFQVQEDDKDYMILEEKIEENQARYHRLNKLHDQARSHQQYVLAFLEDIDCSPDAVLYYLLNETASKVPNSLPKNHSADWMLRSTYLQDDYYEVENDQEALDREDSPDRLKPQKRWRDRFEKLNIPSSTQLAAACLACKVFQEMSEFSIFHVVANAVVTTESGDDKYSLNTYVELGCFLCKSHACPGHGEYIDNEEGEHVCERVKFKIGLPSSDDEIGPYRTNNDSIHELLGLNDDGEEVSGRPWTILYESGHPGFEDSELCSDNCFWLRSARTIVLSKWSSDDNKAFDVLRHAYEFERRGPCLMAQTGIIDKPCKEIFLKLIFGQSEISRFSSKIMNSLSAATTTFPPRKTLEQWLDDDRNTKSYKVDQQEPFTPCDHLGPCSADTDCDCYRQGIHCEKSCACAKSCTRRYPGCKCKAAAKACRTEKCECRRLNRECDPDLCGTCGADEVLDPCNRHNDAVLIGKCNNVSIQRGVPKRTLLGSSKLMSMAGRSGWGLYMGEECRKDDFIGEYCGEIITQAESNQRGVIYDQRDLSYLFTLNAAQTVDGTQLGNKIRFINHQSEPTSNCYAKLRFCNGSVRIGMFASRDVAVSEELFFNYGEEFEAKFEMIKLQSDGSVTTGKIHKAVKQRSTPQQVDTNDGRNSYYQLKNRTSKNGHRLGRPPKSHSQDTRSSSMMANTEEPSIRGRKRKLSETHEPRSSVSTGLSNEASEDEFDQFAIASDEEEPHKKRRRKARSLVSDDSTTAAIPARRFTRSNISAREPTRSRPIQGRTKAETTRNAQRRKGRLQDDEKQNRPMKHVVDSQDLSATKPVSSLDEHTDRDEEENDTPRRSQRKRLEKQHFDEATKDQTPLQMRRTARKLK